MNEVSIIGNMGKDPEIGLTDNGRQWSRFSVATSNDYFDRDNKEWVKKDPDWHSCTVWGDKMVEKVRDLSKGSKVFVRGSIHYSKKDEKYYTTIRVRSFNELVRRESNYYPLPTDEDAPNNLKTVSVLNSDNTVELVELEGMDKDLPF